MLDAENILATKGMIFDIQRFSIHDGPGIRTTVFIKGCPLKCVWCHNPEGISSKPQLSFVNTRCIGCGYCFKVCVRGAHVMKEGKHMLDRAKCASCLLCAKECYARALEVVGQEITVKDVLDEVLKDKLFYETSGGGLTLSGGEPLLAIDFTAALLEAAKRASLHCVVETSGYADPANFRRIRPYVDLFIFDCKEVDPARHIEFTGVSNELILKNLRALVETGASVVLRCPIIPGYNDRREFFEGIASLWRELGRLKGVELMPYHRLGENKMERMGINPARRIKTDAPNRETVIGWVETLKDMGVEVAILLPNI